MPGAVFSAAQLAVIGTDGQLPKLDLAYLLRFYAESHVGIPAVLQVLFQPGVPSLEPDDLPTSRAVVLHRHPNACRSLRRPVHNFALVERFHACNTAVAAAGGEHAAHEPGAGFAQAPHGAGDSGAIRVRVRISAKSPTATYILPARPAKCASIWLIGCV